MAACQVLLQLFQSWYYFITNFIFQSYSIPCDASAFSFPKFILKANNPIIAGNIGKAACLMHRPKHPILITKANIAQISKWHMNLLTKLQTTITDWNYDKSGNNTSTF